jgi:hypothetical protein
MIVTVAVAVLVVFVAIAFAVQRSRSAKRDAVAVERPRALPEVAQPEPALADPPLPEPAVPEPAPAITWTAALTVSTLDETARLRLIDDLMLLAAPWATALLRRAYQEESSPELRARLAFALTSSADPIDVT